MRRGMWLVVGVFALAVAIGAAILLKDRYERPASAGSQGAEDREYYHGEYFRMPREEALRRLDEVDQALDRSPEDIDLIWERIHIGLAHQPEIAIRDCQQLLAKDGTDWSATLHLAMAYMQDGDLDRAMHYAARALKLSDNSASHNMVAHVFYRRGEMKPALRHFRRSVELDPANSDSQQAVDRILRLIDAEK